MLEQVLTCETALEELRHLLYHLCEAAALALEAIWKEESRSDGAGTSAGHGGGNRKKHLGLALGGARFSSRSFSD